MGNIIKTEFLKLKRYSVIKAGIIMTVLSPLLSLFYSTANDGQTWTFDYFMQQVMISNCTLFFPIIIALIAGYIITRECVTMYLPAVRTAGLSGCNISCGSPRTVPTYWRRRCGQTRLQAPMLRGTVSPQGGAVFL